MAGMSKVTRSGHRPLPECLAEPLRCTVLSPWGGSMRRRDFVAALFGTAAWPIAGHAQQTTKVPRIGVLLPGTPASFALRTKALLDELAVLGRVDGKTVAMEWGWGQDRPDTLPALAADLVQSHVDVLVTGGTQAAQGLKAATRPRKRRYL